VDVNTGEMDAILTDGKTFDSNIRSTHYLC